MIYKYKCGKEIIRVFVWNDDFHNEVSIEDTKTHKSYDRTIREDKNGRFFTWNRTKIYLNNWVKISMKELKEKNQISKLTRNIISELIQCIYVKEDGCLRIKFNYKSCE